MFGIRTQWVWMVVACAGFASAAGAQRGAVETAPSAVASDFAGVWERARDYTLEVARAMPAESYDFKATPDQMSFAEHLLHIAGSNQQFSRNFLLDEELPELDTTSPGRSKERILELLETSFDYGARGIAAVTDAELSEEVDLFGMTVPRLRVMLLMRDHVTHHRGQLVVYLRLKGITPPRFRGW